MRRRVCFLYTLLLVLLTGIEVSGQDGVKITRLSSEIQFDGYPYEEAWNGLEYFPLTQNRPNFGTDPIEKSEIMITYDDEYLWVGARLFMQDATRIVATSKKRDETSRNSDTFGVIIDSFNDNENALAFFTMPTGLRIDYDISNDGERSGGGGGQGRGGTPMGPGTNLSWNTFWDVETTRDDKGWYVEMRIPFSSLRFQPEGNVSTMGLIINRTISAHNATDTYPALDPRYGFSATRKPSLAVDAVFEGARPSKPIYISPYVIGGFSRDWLLNPEETEYISDDNPDFNAGLDVKYSINSNLTLDLTANTDFAQVEADDQQVNLTRYSLYFPEKRKFFQERSGLFSFSLGGTSNLFYSRNIGLSRGEPIRIYGGARLVGRIGDWDVGFMDMQTEEHGESPGENFGVFRLRRRVINENSFVGGIFTSRLGMDGSRNFAYGLDGIFRVYGDDYFDIKIAQTYDDAIGNEFTSVLDPTFFSVNWERRSEEGFAYQLGYSYSGQEFEPGIGFVRQGSMQNISGNVLYGWLPGPESRFFSYQGNIRFSRYIRLEDGLLESMSIEPGWEMNTKSGYRIELSLEYQQEGVISGFSISDDVQVESGDYEFIGSRIQIRTPSSKPVSANININMGQFYDGQRYGFSVRPYYNVSSSLQISGSYQFNHVQFPTRDQKVNIHSTTARATIMFNTKLSASIFVQYTNTDDDLISNFRLRYNPREGNDFYLVYNEYRGVSNDGIELEPPNYFNRTIMLKYTHTFRL